MTLKDCGAFALKMFQNREAWSGKTLLATSHFVNGKEIAETLSRVSRRQGALRAHLDQRMG